MEKVLGLDPVVRRTSAAERSVLEVCYSVLNRHDQPRGAFQVRRPPATHSAR